MFMFAVCRADHWDLTNPSWVGRVRVCTFGTKCLMKFEDKTTGNILNTLDSAY